ncbi:MAG: hypothetical protein ACK4P4_22310 [Allorhizobium sp.]
MQTAPTLRIERARAIVVQQGGDLALAARDMNEPAIAEAGNALGQAITEALLAVFEGLLDE